MDKWGGVVVWKCDGFKINGLPGNGPSTPFPALIGGELRREEIEVEEEEEKEKGGGYSALCIQRQFHFVLTTGERT